VFDLRIESGSLDFLRFSLYPNRLGIYSPDGKWYRNQQNVYIDISLGSQSPTSSRKVGKPPTRHTRHRIGGESDTTHFNLKGTLVLGKVGEVHTEDFAGAEFRYHPYVMTMRNLKTTGVLVYPGERILWNVPPYYSGYHYEISVIETQVPLGRRGFILRYHTTNGWRSECFTGLLIDLHTGTYYQTNVWQVQLLKDDTSTADQYVQRIGQLLRTAIPQTPFNDQVMLGADATSSLSQSDIETLLQRHTLSELESKLREEIFVDPEKERICIANLAQRACSNFKPVQANTLSTLIELSHLHGEIEDWIGGLEEVAKSVRHPGKLLQAIGNLRLSTKWGIPLTVKDAREIADVFTDDLVYGRRRDRWQSQRVQSTKDDIHAFGRGVLRGTSIDYVIGLKAIVAKQDSRAKQMLSTAFDYNLLSLSNIWDMVPYSFVVDWFTNVSERIELIDATLYKDTFLDVRGSVVTRKFTFPLSATVLERLLDIPVKESTLECTLFSRTISEDLPWPTLQDKEISSNLGYVQYLDGATLILQRVKFN